MSELDEVEVLDNIEEDVKDNEEVVETSEEIKPNKETKPDKKKRVLSEKQKEALSKGRELGLQKLKERGELTKQKKQVKQKILENNVKDIEELKKVAEFATIDKRIAELTEHFKNVNSKVTELYELKKKKNNQKYKEQLENQIKVDSQLHLLNKKTQEYSRWDNL